MGCGQKLGVEKYYNYLEKFGLLEKTGIDLPGEAGSIFLKEEKVGPVELATISFGQRFEVTPIQMLSMVSTIANKGIKVTPRILKAVLDGETGERRDIEVKGKRQVISKETAEEVLSMMESVVAEGTGKNGGVEGFSIGGKTATSETLPRGSGKYIASFVGFYPAEEPKVLAMVIIHKPKGMYYGGQVAAPVVKQLFQNILPYLDRVDYN